VHSNTVPALRLLEAEGFSRRGYIDIFDAGPTVEAELKQIRAIRDSDKYQVLIDDACGSESNQKYIICNTKVEGFRATQVKLTLRETANQVVITSETAQALQVQQGDWVRLLSN
jgi:arginine N-succinyltransferase